MRMSKNLRRLLVGCTLLLAILFAAFLWLRPLLNIGAGYAAKHACSCHFLQGRALEDIRTLDLNFSVLGWVKLKAKENEVHSSFFGLVPRRAVYRQGVGCTLINDEAQPLVAVEDLGTFDKLSGTGAAGAAQGPRAVVNPPAALRAAFETTMAPQPGGGTRGIVVLHNGQLIAEAYAPGFGPETPQLGWSMTKTLTAMALGTALVSPTSPAAAPQKTVAQNHLFPETWTDSARQQITLADLLHMNSGLAWNEAYGSLSDATIMLHEHANMARYAYDVPAVSPRNTAWNYSSGTTNILAELIDRETPGLTTHAFMHQLFHQVAPSLLIEPSQAGLPVGSSYGWATARDWANLGQFMLQDGVWQGDTLLPPGWINWMRQPAAGSGGIYGGQLWLPGPDMPDLPRDAYMMRGFQDQRVFVIPSDGLVIARLAHENDQVMNFALMVEQIRDGVRNISPKQGTPAVDN
ncbi:MAG: serine hydrolase [Bacteroidota bacterium]